MFKKFFKGLSLGLSGVSYYDVVAQQKRQEDIKLGR